MKKSLIALAALGLFAGAAAAQSSVTLFGLLDVNMRYVKSSGKTLKLLGTDGLNSSRLGVRGTEDLGGGLKAAFWLESAVNPDTGTVDATRFWGRRSTVSVMGDFGELRLGRAKTSVRLHIDDFDPYSTTGLGDSSKVYSALGSAADTLNRSDNMVSYFLPNNIGGVYGSVDVAAGEGAVGKKMQSFRLGYKVGGLNVAGGYASTTGTGNLKYTLTSGGAAYDFGLAKVSLNLSETKYNGRKQSITTLGLTAPLGQGQVLASFTDSKANTAAEALAGVGDAKLFAVGYVYNLSKRSALYTTAAQIRNNGKGTFAVSGSPAVTAAAKSSGLDVGLRHTF